MPSGIPLDVSRYGLKHTRTVLPPGTVVCEYAVTLSKDALEQIASPLIPEPGINLLKVHGTAFEACFARVHDTYSGVLDRQA